MPLLAKFQRLLARLLAKPQNAKILKNLVSKNFMRFTQLDKAVAKSVSRLLARNLTRSKNHQNQKTLINKGKFEHKKASTTGFEPAAGRLGGDSSIHLRYVDK